MIITNVKLGFLIKRVFVFLAQTLFFVFWIRKNPTIRKTHFVGSGELVKPRLFQALTRGARPDSNSRPAMQISNSLLSCYVIWGHFFLPCDFLTSAKSNLVDQQFIYGNPSLLLIYLLLGLIFKFVLQFFGQKIVKNWDEKI